MSFKSTTYTKITAQIILGMLLTTLVFSLVYGEYVKHQAIKNLAQIDAHKTSRLVFESLYSAMVKGWNKEELQAIITRLNRVEKTLTINVHRAPPVADLYGDIAKDKQARESNPKIKQAMEEGQEILDIQDNEIIDYYFPVQADQNCLECHANAKPNDTLGIIRVSYPVSELKVSLNEMINFFMLFITLFSILIFVALFLNFRRYLLQPIKNFVDLLNTIKNSQDIKQRITVENNIKEIRSMQSVFNDMLDSIEKQFYYDTMTGLRNRHSLLEITEQQAESLLMIIDIDRFQELNNLYGDQVGDGVLKELASTLIELLPDNANLFRLHADEFAYLSSGDMDIKEFESLAAYLVSSIAHKTFPIDTKDKNNINISITIGIALGTDLLLPHADIALKIAKKEKKNWLIYDETMQAKQKFEMNFSWGKRLNQAIEEHKITALYQPIAECKTGEIVKYECLMRIKDDHQEYISPVHFLELAKKNKVYHQLTIAVLQEAFNTFRHNEYKFSVNLSVEDILNEEVVALILSELKHNTFTGRLVVEIIESEGIENFDAVVSFIENIKKHGAKISIDDFGTGYSNFEYLLRLKVDYIKIDGSMIKNITTDTYSKMLVQTIVDFANKVDIQTIAEYVYSKEIFDEVREMGVDYAQGYYFGQPTRHIG